MPRRAFAYSAAFHVAVLVGLWALVHFHLFERRIDEEQPIAVQLVNIAPETRATRINPAPPAPEKKPDQKAEVEPPKPKPEPPKPAPPPESKPEPPQAVTPPPPPPPPPPEAKPKPQPQEAKVEPPKPPPPKPKPPKKKDDDLAFDAMLKNIAKHDPTLQPVDKPQKQVAAAPPQRSSQPIAPLGAQLTTSELDVVKQQIEQCWNVPAGARDAKDLTPEFRVYMNRDGTVQSATQLNPERNGDPYFQAAAEAAARALRNPSCQPLKLPPDKYDQWQTFTITFDPKDL
ncbi:MAG TPA: energy transducer TonB [Stellaceae bacterium]|nr:energy transducer TonB [Stellaceae bacterium]